MNENHANEQDLKSVFTTNLPGILQQLNISIAVSTYQCGKLILVRRDNQGINTHFRNFNRPMGVAVKPDRISIGCLKTVENYQNIPALIGRLDDPAKYDACYVPRYTIDTGSVDIHEMAWGENNTLWMVNTRFSCLHHGHGIQLLPAMAAIVCDGACAGRSLSLKRSRDG